MTSINSLLHFHHGDTTFEIIWLKCHSLQWTYKWEVSGKLEFKAYVLLLFFFSFFPFWFLRFPLTSHSWEATSRLSLACHLSHTWETGRLAVSVCIIALLKTGFQELVRSPTFTPQFLQRETPDTGVIRVPGSILDGAQFHHATQIWKINLWKNNLVRKWQTSYSVASITHLESWDMFGSNQNKAS